MKIQVQLGSTRVPSQRPGAKEIIRVLDGCPLVPSRKSACRRGPSENSRGSRKTWLPEGVLVKIPGARGVPSENQGAMRKIRVLEGCLAEILVPPGKFRPLSKHFGAGGTLPDTK